MPQPMGLLSTAWYWCLAEADTVGDGLGLMEGLADGLVVKLLEGVAVGEDVADEVKEVVGLGVGLSESVGLLVGVPEDVVVAEGDGVGVEVACSGWLTQPNDLLHMVADGGVKSGGTPEATAFGTMG